jgi:hypothetical protein
MVPRLLYITCPGEITSIDALDLDEADWPLPEPCVACGKPASPFVETASGPLCFTCADTDGPDAPPGAGARAAWRDAVLLRTFHRLQAARLARELAPTPIIVPIGR